MPDLASEQAAVLETVRESEWVARHSYRASEQNLVATCLEDVETSDYYFGIIGQRYGYVPFDRHRNPESKSITHLEFDRARDSGIPTFVFVKSDRARYRPSDLDSHSGDHDAGRKIAAFRGLLMSGKHFVVDLFDEPADLRVKIAQLVGLLNFRDRPPRKRTLPGLAVEASATEPARKCRWSSRC